MLDNHDNNSGCLEALSSSSAAVISTDDNSDNPDQLLEDFPVQRLSQLGKSKSLRVLPTSSMSPPGGGFYRSMVDSASKSFRDLFSEDNAQSRLSTRSLGLQCPLSVHSMGNERSPASIGPFLKREVSTPPRRAVSPIPLADVRRRFQEGPTISFESIQSFGSTKSLTPPRYSKPMVSDTDPLTPRRQIIRSRSLRDLDLGTPYRSPRRLLEETIMGLTPTETLLNSDSEDSSLSSNDSDGSSDEPPNAMDIPASPLAPIPPVFLPNLQHVSGGYMTPPTDISREDRTDVIVSQPKRKYERRGSYSAPGSQYRKYQPHFPPESESSKTLGITADKVAVSPSLRAVIAGAPSPQDPSLLLTAKAAPVSPLSSPPDDPLRALIDSMVDSDTASAGGLFQDAEIVDSGSVQIPSAPAIPSSKARTSFTADSPYYTSYVEQEMQQLQVLNDTLRDISARAKTFGKCGALMAESTRRLALACKLRPPPPNGEGSGTASSNTGEETAEARQEQEEQLVLERQESVGEEMGSVLSVLGDVLNEIADAQVQMCDSLEASLAMSLEAFCGTELHEVQLLKAEAEQCTEVAENSLSRYLNGRHAPNSTDRVPTESWNKVSEQIGQQVGGTLEKWKRGDIAAGASTSERGGLKNWRSSSAQSSGSNGHATLREESAGRSKGRNSVDPSILMASTAANLQLSLEQIRMAQATAELKRFQLLKKIVNIKKRRNFELGESALASLHGIRAYFDHCSDLVQGLSPRMHRLHEAQRTSRDKHTAELQPWETRQQGLMDALDAIGSAASNAQIAADGIAQGDDRFLEDQATALDAIESRTQLWEVSTMLAESSRYQRDPAPGVIVEGWLYKKSSSRMALTQWAKRWFMMDKDGIYYFRSNNEAKKANAGTGKYLHTLERVKICDVVLCMVREVPPSDGYRFCFEIVTPSQKPLMLQARGPAEYRMWVDGVRSGVERQLVHGDVSVDSLMKDIGKKKKRGSSVPEKTLGSMLSDETFGDGVDTSVDTGGDVPTPQLRDSYDIDEDESVLQGASAHGDLVEASKKSRSETVKKIMEANPCCADCGMPDPDWVAINLGVVLCIECSGVHRSLGVHVSKVRSLMLDSLSDVEGKLLLDLGNDRINPIWEAGLHHQKGWKKPTASDSRKTKEDWIRSKYQWKGFLLQRDSDGTTEKEREEKWTRDLYEAARTANVLAAAEALAHGASIDWKNDSDGGKTALHVCAISHPIQDEGDEAACWQGVECAEMLLQNGAKMSILDESHHGVLDCAVIGNAEREMIEYLSARTT